jgi:hypothetical protein
MSIDIFYKTYHQDKKWLEYSLRSLSKFVTGYRNIVILVPINDKRYFESIVLPERATIQYVKEYGTGYLYQQLCKIQAHKYTDAEFILFSDSDLIFDHPINLQDFIADGKPEILYTSYDKVGDAICWKEPTETFIKEPQEFEWMRRNALIYHRSTLVNIEKYEPNLEYIIMTSQRFSEYNAIGAYAWKYEREKYNFVNTDTWEYTRPKAIQYHSYTEFEKMINEFKDL